MMPRDSFEGLARYYDAIMSHVNYDRWFVATTELGTLLPPNPRHLDAACGTALLLHRLRRIGWDSHGIDLSFAMLRAGSRRTDRLPLANADLRALPFNGCFDYVTCLFDSINFLLDIGDVRRAFREIAGALRDGGLFYFDIVTERMVTLHFAGQRWIEDNGKFSTSWESEYVRKNRLTTTHICVQNGPVCSIAERIYPPEEVRAALEAAGFTLLAMLDAETWGDVRRKSVRIDFVAIKGDAAPYRKDYLNVRESVRALMG